MIDTGQHNTFLIERLKAKDEKAFEYLYDNYSAALYGVILRTVWDDKIAQETLQDVFLKIWHQAGQYDVKKGSLFTWMYRIARNQAIDVRRSREYKAKDKSNPLEDYVHTIETAGNNPDHTDIGTLINEVGNECKKLLYSNFFMGYTHAEIAKNDQLPLGTVKTKLRNCLKKIRELLKEEIE